jgi:pyruvate kinase
MGKTFQESFMSQSPAENLTPRRAKIVCTLGPASSTYEQIKALAQAGLDVARFNFSHGSYPDHEERYAIVRQVAKDLNKPIAILQDLQGPKIRVGRFVDGQIELKAGQKFILTVRKVEGTDKEVSVSYPTFNQDVSPGERVLLDDGNLTLEVDAVKGEDVECTVVFGGILKNNKGVNLPGSILSVDALTAKDKRDLDFGLELGVDFVALSFVQKPEDIQEIKAIIAAKGKRVPVIAKIEKPQAVENLRAILDLTDGIMIARGDLGVELPVEDVPHIQKEIIDLCKKKGKPVITATQMLESMVKNPRPTRAEATDVANAVLDGTDAVMLSAETASGDYPLEAVQNMHNIIANIERNRPEAIEKRPKLKKVERDALAIGQAASNAAEVINASKILCLTDSGSTARVLSRFRPTKPIIAMSRSEEVLREMALYWGVSGFLVPDFGDNVDDAVEKIIAGLKSVGMVSPGEKVVITAGLPFTQKRDTNMLRIETVD